MGWTAQELVSAGTKKRDIPVSISYRILELFSAGLYSSPNKALEELVANSYDAFAQNVHIVLPTNLESADAVIWVIDDGESMDENGIVDLWRIAASRKREPGRNVRDRPPIGRFGIGKLATFVLASQLTYVMKHGGTYRAITMDFASVPHDRTAEHTVNLDLRILTAADAEHLLAPLMSRSEVGFKRLPLFGNKVRPTWTVAAMAKLKTLSYKITPGRLKWVLSTALPLSPRFSLYFNGEAVASSKTDLEPIRTWTIGVADRPAAQLRQTAHADRVPPVVEIDGLGPISGVSAIYADPLTGGKAESWGRSHGIFVIVRGRLINLDDPLFGLSQFSHGPFSRFRMEVHADGLDELLRSSRESVLESTGVDQLRTYLVAKYNEARSAYDEWVGEKEKTERITTRVDSTPQSLSRRPLVAAIRAVLEGKSPPMMLTDVPQNLTGAVRDALLEQLQTSLETEEGFIREVKFDPLGIQQPIARFEALTGRVLVNSLHPFYANYSDLYHSPEPFELLAIAEILTEAYLIEEGVDHETVLRVLKRRDRFLRELVYSRQLAAPLVAELLRENAANADGLEQAVAAGLRSLGFEVSPIGGNGEPDGTALARLGVRDEETGQRADYVITYDAKSTARDSVAAHTVGTATIRRHREKYKAQFSLVIARDFHGADDPNSAINVEAKTQAVTLMTIDDLIRLVLAAATRQLGFVQIRTLFENCRTPTESRQWIDAALQKEVTPGPLPEILDAIWELQKDSIDAVRFAAVAQAPKLKGRYRIRDLQEWMQSARRLAGGFVTIENDIVSIEAPPQKILRQLRLQVANLPVPFRPPEVPGTEEDDEPLGG